MIHNPENWLSRVDNLRGIPSEKTQYHAKAINHVKFVEPEIAPDMVDVSVKPIQVTPDPVQEVSKEEAMAKNHAMAENAQRSEPAYVSPAVLAYAEVLAQAEKDVALLEGATCADKAEELPPLEDIPTPTDRNESTDINESDDTEEQNVSMSGEFITLTVSNMINRAYAEDHHPIEPDDDDYVKSCDSDDDECEDDPAYMEAKRAMLEFIGDVEGPDA
jgi:hypothetical protein